MSPSTLRMTPTFLHVLLLLVEGDMHGYPIMREIEHRTEGRLKLGPSSLYWSLGRLEAAGLIEEAGERPDPEADDERRRYWRITAVGRARLQEEVRLLGDIVAHAEALKVVDPGGRRG